MAFLPVGYFSCWNQTKKLSFYFMSQHCSREHNAQLTFCLAQFSLTWRWLPFLNSPWLTGPLRATTVIPQLFYPSTVESNPNPKTLLFWQFISHVRQRHPSAPQCRPLQMIPHITKDSIENMARWTIWWYSIRCVLYKHVNLEKYKIKHCCWYIGLQNDDVHI